MKITDCLQHWNEKRDNDAFNELLSMVYYDLRKSARRLILDYFDTTSHVGLTPSVLLNDALVKFFGKTEGTPWENRAQFFLFMKRTMINAILDYLKSAEVLHRAPGLQPDEQDGDGIDMLALREKEKALDQALARLGKVHPNWAKVIYLRFFEEMGPEVIAQILGVSISSVRNWHQNGLTWLARHRDEYLIT